MFHGRNVLFFWSSVNNPKDLVGQMLVFLVAYSFLMALFLPFVNALLKTVASSIFLTWVEREARRTGKWTKGFKEPFRVKCNALKTRDEFDMRRVSEYREERRQMALDRMASMSVVLLLAFNWVLDDISISNGFYEYFQNVESSLGRIILLLMSGWLAFVLVVGAWLSIWPSEDRIYLPRPDDYDLKIKDADLVFETMEARRE
jgi:hypothetical protein